MSYALGIDLGTGSLKALLVDGEGRVLARASAGYPLLKPHPGWVEQDPEAWWEALCSAVRRVLEQARVPPAAILAGVACGLFADFERACAALIELGEPVPCDPERAAFYEEAFRRYCGLYPALREWFGGEVKKDSDPLDLVV